MAVGLRFIVEPLERTVSVWEYTLYIISMRSRIFTQQEVGTAPLATTVKTKCTACKTVKVGVLSFRLRECSSDVEVSLTYANMLS